MAYPLSATVVQSEFISRNACDGHRDTEQVYAFAQYIQIAQLTIQKPLCLSV